MMSVILPEYGDEACEHEGYAAQVLTDGSLTSTYNADTLPRMVGAVLAACGCGWTGVTRYPTPAPCSDEAQKLALAEWERDHARPTLDARRGLTWDRLCLTVQLAQTRLTASHAGFTELTPQEQRDLLDWALGTLHAAVELGQQLRRPVPTDPTSGGERP